MNFIIPMDFPFKDTVSWLFYGTCREVSGPCKTDNNKAHSDAKQRSVVYSFANETNFFSPCFLSAFFLYIYIYLPMSPYSTILYSLTLYDISFDKLCVHTVG